MSVAVLDPHEVAVSRTEFDIDSGNIRVDQAGLDWGDAAIQTYLADAKVGSYPVDFRMPNRKVTIPLGLGMDDSGLFDEVRRSLTAKVALFHREGGWLKRQLTDGSHVFADVADATLKLPDKWGDVGKLEAEVSLVLECLPDFYGDEITLDSFSGTNGIAVGVLKQGGVQAAVAGDYPARTRVILTDTSGHDKQAALGGFRSRKYDPNPTAQLSYECEALTPLDAATVQTVAGCSGGQGIQHPHLTAGSWAPVMATTVAGVGEMTHRGMYRVWARYTTSGQASLRFRLLWGTADVAHPEENPAANPDINDFYKVDLGVVRLDPTPAAGYWWKGVVQVMSQVNDQDVTLDRLIFQPVDESAWFASAVPAMDQVQITTTSQQKRPVTVVDDASYGTFAWDNPAFAANPDGWPSTNGPTSGASSTHYLKATNFGLSVPASATIIGIGAAVLRSCATGWTSDDRVRIVKGGTIQTADRASPDTWPWTAGQPNYQWATYGTPNVWASTDLWGTTWTPADINDPGFGVALAAKKLSPQDEAFVDAFGIIVFYTTASGGGFTIQSDAVCYANRQAEFRTEGLYRQDSTGQVFGEIAVPLGDLPRLPPSGSEARACELLLATSRLTTTNPGDYTYLQDPGLDPFSVQVKYRPCYLFRP